MHNLYSFYIESLAIKNGWEKISYKASSRIHHAQNTITITSEQLSKPKALIITKCTMKSSYPYLLNWFLMCMWNCQNVEPSLNQNSEQNMSVALKMTTFRGNNPILIFIPSSLQHLTKYQVAEVFSPRSPFYSIIKTHRLG